MVTKQSQDVKFIIGNIVNNSLITMHGAGGYLKHQSDQVVNYMVV